MAKNTYTTKKYKQLRSISISWGGMMLQIPSEVITAYVQCSCVPSIENLFKAFKLCPLENVRVVIIGQDPYPENCRGKAYGLAFMNDDIKDSLQNIKKELEKEGYKLESADLTSWASQGVLLMNTWLSTTKGKAGKHRELGWKETVTDKVIDKLISDNNPKVFLIWGNVARDLVNERFFKAKGFHLYHIKDHKVPSEEINQEISNILYLYSAHPSNKSVNRGAKPSFIGNKHFNFANSFLFWNLKGKIDWSTKKSDEVTDEMENDLTTEDKIATQNAKPRRPSLNFYEMGMKNGDVLKWKDDPSIFVVIKSERKVTYNGEEVSISALSAQLKGYNTKHIAPGKYWMYKERLLDDIYDETYPFEE